MRYLDIGPKDFRLDGFETLDKKPLEGIDYVCDASEHLPFEDNIFDLIHASHILEHIDWRKSQETLREWVRVLKPGGWLEVWVPDAGKIAKHFLDEEKTYQEEGEDPCIRYSISSMVPGHKAAFSERYLKKLLRRCGLTMICKMNNDEARHPKAENYQWKNLGIKGKKTK